MMNAALPLAAAAVAEQLAAGMPVAAPIALVAAHPDDETLGAGGRLGLLANWRLVHLTDGAPLDPADARRAGCATRQAYARRRRDELGAALQALAAAPADAAALGCVDREAMFALAPLTRQLVPLLAGVAAVVTHAYEHGHPDHDAAAFCVHAACALLRRAGAAVPRIVEFAGYHVAGGEFVAGQFWPEPGNPDCLALLSRRDFARKAAAIACFATQRDFLARFPLRSERYREAPSYDFRQPAPPQSAWYEVLGWSVTCADWLRCTAAALHELGLPGPP